MIAFGKRRTCPPSETILSYVEGSFQSLLIGPVVAAHVRNCDFCGAEMQFLSKHIPKTEDQTFGLIKSWAPTVRELFKLSQQRAA
jgi:anti-sigma factor ChrR (cupin superfamily)